MADKETAGPGWLNKLLTLVTIIAATVFIGTIASQYSGLFQGSRPKVGSFAELEGVQWAIHQRTLIFALQEACPYCEASMPLYKELLAASQNGTTFHPVAIFPRGEAIGRVVLKKHGVEMDDVRGGDLDRLGVVGTPTLILVGSDGRIARVWSGKLSQRQEDEVFQALQIARRNYSGELLREIKPGEDVIKLAEFSRVYRSVPVIDSRYRYLFRGSHIVGALNIPDNELEARAQHEISKDAEVILVCDYCLACTAETPLRTACERDVAFMKALGFSRTKAFLAWDQIAMENAGIQLAKN
jgi:hypothetical protein